MLWKQSAIIQIRKGEGESDSDLKRRHNTQHNDIQHKDTQYKDTQNKYTQHKDTQYNGLVTTLIINDTQHNSIESH